MKMHWVIQERPPSATTPRLFTELAHVARLSQPLGWLGQVYALAPKSTDLWMSLARDVGPLLNVFILRLLGHIWED